MKSLRTYTKILTTLLLVSIILTFASCTLLGGSLKLKSFTVDRSTVKTSYYVGEEIDFSGIQATATYSDESLTKVYTFDELTITYDKDITATIGQKTVTVSFMDPNLNVEQRTTVSITVSEDPNAPKHSGYVVDYSGMKTTYLVGETLDFTGVKVIEKFTNGGADVEMTDTTKIAYAFDEDITAAPGSKNVAVTYDGESAGVIPITVKYPEITGITLNSDDVKKNYMVGETIDLTGLTATVTYENGSSETVTEFTAGALDMSTPGDKTVSVSFADPISGVAHTDSFAVKVDGIVDYTVSTDGMTLTYLEGDTVSFDGLVVSAVYYYGSTKVLEATEYTLDYSDDITAVPGNKTVSVKVGDKEIDTIIITVGDIPVASANVENVDLSYRVGETVSLAGLTVTLTYTDGTESDVIALEDLIVVTDLAGLTATAGTKPVSVKYLFDGDIELYANVTVTVYGVDSYTVNTENVKTSYIAGDTADYAGISILANYKDGGAPVAIDPASVTYDVSGALTTVGTTTVHISLNGSVIGSFNLTVGKNTIESTVIGGTFDTSYEVGDTVDFSDLTVTVTYKNGKVVELTYADLKIGAVDTATAGNKTVIVSFTDEINNETAQTSFTVNVIKAKPTVSQFEKPTGINSFDSNNKDAGTLNYGDTGFSGQYLNGDKLYVIGDDNEFRFNPLFSVLDGGTLTSLSAYYTTVDLYLHDGTDYVLLDKVADPTKPTEVSYYNGSELFAVVDTYSGLYSFKTTAEKIKISVLPSEEYYVLNNNNPVVLEARVIDAYNVYEAWQLAVIDNYTKRDDWNAFKNEKGIAGVNPAGIVIHNDIHISASDVPASFFNASTKDVTYYKVVDGVVEETSVAPAGTKYLVDGTVIYRRTSTSDFVIEGNFFAIDTRNFPLIASPAVFDANLDLDYGSDYSNATLFMFEGTSSNWTPVTPPDVTVENVTFIGNASRDNWLDAETDGNLVTAGGLILLKSSRYANTTMTNTLNNSFFIAYFPDYTGVLNVKDSKCYDSYQNGAFVWADSVFNVDNTFINGSGGPIVISQSVKETVNGTEMYLSPVTNVNGSKIETHVTGEEIWFKAVGATSLVGNIKALGGGLDQLVSAVTSQAMGQTVHANWVDGQGKMNIKAILMPKGTGTDALTDAMIQGTATFEGAGIKRWYEATENHNPDWYEILTNPYFQAGAPFLTVVGADGTEHTIYFVQQGEAGTFYDMNGLAIGTESPDTAAIIAAFASADQVVLHQGGLSAVFELYH